MSDRKVYEKIRKQKDKKFQKAKAHYPSALEYSRWLDQEIARKEDELEKLRKKLKETERR